MIKAVCHKCHSPLVVRDVDKGEDLVVVEPCEECLREQYKEGWQDGIFEVS